jgi:hypothetical protein
LKPLPDNLKYIFIGNNNTLGIIVKGLTSVQKEKLVKLLCDHKTTISWTLANIKCIISPSMCLHHILLEDNAKPTREMQRRLNPTMMAVVKVEILKLLDA